MMIPLAAMALEQTRSQTQIEPCKAKATKQDYRGNLHKSFQAESCRWREA